MAVSVLGRDLAAWGRSYYERIGVAFELPNHFPALTALEDLACIAALYCRPARPPLEVLAQVGLEGDALLAAPRHPPAPLLCVGALWGGAAGYPPAQPRPLLLGRVHRAVQHRGAQLGQQLAEARPRPQPQLLEEATVHG